MKSKRIISMFLAIMILLSGLPIGDMVAWAEGEIEPIFKSIAVNKIFRDLYGAEKYSILITGDNFIIDNINQVEVGIMGEDGIVKAFNPTYTSKTMVQYELEPDQISGDLYINGEKIDISEGDIPYITNKTPTTGMVDSAGDGKITLEGSGFQNLSNTIKAYLFQGTTAYEVSNTEGNDTKLTSEILKGKTGIWSVRFDKEDEITDLNNAKLTISHRYMNMFSVINKLDVSDKIDMIPTQGPVESTVTLQADNLKPTNEMSVFFLKNLDDPYLASHMGTDENYRRDIENNKDIFSFKVPKALEVGSYYVVLTNEVDPKKDIESQIKSYKILDTKFIVIDRKNMVTIESIEPNKGSSKGVDATIKGINIARISPDIYEGGNRDNVDIKTDTNKMIITYTGGTYKMIGKDGVVVQTLTREIKFFVGSQVTFKEGSRLDESVYDYINVRVGENPDKQDLVKDVIVEIDTIITYEENGVEKTANVFETYTLEKGFTYEPLDYEPKITSIIPDKIPVDENMNAMEGLKVAIIGENFLLYRYRDKDNNIKYKYPKFDFGGQFTIEPNKNGNIDIRILDKQGNEIDGTEGNDLGSKILLTIPAGKNVSEDILNSQIDLKLTNPVRVPDSEDEGSSAVYKFQFIKPEGDKTPIITSVFPDTITTIGYKGVKIVGQNFSENFNLYIDGERITNAKRNGTGTEITFDAPPKNEGYVQLIVQNDDGALGVFNDFLYVKTYTNPKIIDFNPKEGTAYTLVDLKGENLVPPNPLVKELEGIGFMKLIGTRVFIGGKDINTYTANRKLQPYETPEDNPIVKADKNSVVLADYSHSIILEDENETYYKIYFDTTLGKHLLTNGDKDVYEIVVKDGKLYGKKGGTENLVEITNKQVKIDGKTLNIKTPYAVEEDKDTGEKIITGNRVKVLNNNELYFTVPPQPREGYYDIAVVNPDANRDERKDQAGFYYFFQPGEKPPKIDKIQPSEGSTEGQYHIYIYGENFVDRGLDQKTSVIIGGVVVPPQDIEVYPDGKTMKVKVPKYPGDLSTETEMDRKHVNVVVTNPDGGSDKLIDGFAYIIPISHPRINRLILNKGSAAGGDIVTIEGSDFRYFEPFRDANNNGSWDEGEEFTDKNYNGEWDDLRDRAVLDRLKQEENGWDELVLPILPTVYFDGKPAEIKSFTSSTIDVLVPKGKSGPVEVYLVNNDYGVSNAVTYTYEASNPRIDSITPGTGRKQGGDRIEILGESFALSQVYMYEELEKPAVEKELVQVGFGNERDPNMSNSSLPLSNPNSGRIRDQKATARAGELEISYDATEATRLLDVRLVENDIEYRQTKIPYQDQEVFLPLNLLKDDEGQAYPGRELVRIKLEIVAGASNTFKLRIDRGFAPEASLANSKQINVTTPSYYTIGRVAVTVINPDGGTATGSFQYKNPDSNPIITNILRDGQEGYQVDDGRTIVEVNYLGGNTIEVIGSDFRRPVRIRIGDSTVIPHNEIEYQPENESVSNRLIFRMPEVDGRYIGTYNRLVVENDDGGFASSEPIYLKFFHPESTGLSISRLIPNFGPTEGGTLITIEGRDFRKTMDGFPNGELKVYFGSGSKQVQVTAEDIVSVSFDKILLRTPAYTAGPADIKVENPDGNIAELPKGFHYVSNPKIRAVVDPDNDDLLIETLSVEGGERIKIVGSDFMPGARVVFVPVLELLEDQSSAPANSITIDTERYILEDGMEGIEVEVLNGQEILVTSPEGKLDDKGLIVINPDNGATNVYNISYGIPEMGAPLNVEADLVFDQYIRVNWSPVRDAYEYEIYMSENGGQFQFIGSTELTSFVVDRIRPRTQYQFLVRAIGRYGSSKPIDESKSNIVVTGRTSGPKDHDGKPTDRTEIQREGDKANIIIGAKDFTSRGMTIDLTRGELAGVRDVILRIPANIVVDSPGAITILARDYTMKFAPGIFRNSTMEDNRRNSNAGIVFEIASYKGNSNIKPGSSIVGEVYSLKGSYYVGKANGSLDHLNGLLEFNLDYDRLKANNSRLRSINLARYHEGQRDWLPVTRLDRLGLYTIIGSRR